MIGDLETWADVERLAERVEPGEYLFTFQLEHLPETERMIKLLLLDRGPNGETLSGLLRRRNLIVCVDATGLYVA